MRSKEAINWVRSFKAGQRWLNSVLSSGIGSEGSEKVYARNLKIFCDIVKKNPDELIQERLEQLKSDNELDKYAAEEQLQAVYLKIKNAGKPGVARMVWMAVKSFYKHNRVPLQLQTPKWITVPPKPVTFEDFKLVYKAAAPNKKVWLAILKDTGMSREDAIRLTYGDIKEEFEAGHEFITLNVIRRKEAVRYTTFLGPDSVQAIKDWFKILEKKGVKITEKTPLITARNGKPLKNPEYLTNEIRRYSKKFGVIITPHRIRKMFATLMAMQGIHPVILKHWMGHKIFRTDVESRYILPPVPEQKRLYMQAYPAISISEAVKREKEKANLIEQLLAELGFDEKAARIVRKYNLTRSLSVGEIVALLQQLRTE